MDPSRPDGRHGATKHGKGADHRGPDVRCDHAARTVRCGVRRRRTWADAVRPDRSDQEALQPPERRHRGWIYVETIRGRGGCTTRQTTPADCQRAELTECASRRLRERIRFLVRRGEDDRGRVTARAVGRIAPGRPGVVDMRRGRVARRRMSERQLDGAEGLCDGRQRDERRGAEHDQSRPCRAPKAPQDVALNSRHGHGAILWTIAIMRLDKHQTRLVRSSPVSFRPLR